jgi:hypothetical protein
MTLLSHWRTIMIIIIIIIKEPSQWRICLNFSNFVALLACFLPISGEPFLGGLLHFIYFTTAHMQINCKQGISVWCLPCVVTHGISYMERQILLHLVIGGGGCVCKELSLKINWNFPLVEDPKFWLGKGSPTFIRFLNFVSCVFSCFYFLLPLFFLWIGSHPYLFHLQGFSPKFWKALYIK